VTLRRRIKTHIIRYHTPNRMQTPQIKHVVHCHKCKKGKCSFTSNFKSLGSAVGIATGGPRGRSSSLSRVKNFSLSLSSIPVLDPTQSPIQRVPWAPAASVKRPVYEADRSPPSSENAYLYIRFHTPSWRSSCLNTGTALVLHPTLFCIYFHVSY
jgi:hypothetical protein